MELQVKRLYSDANIPERQNPGDAGLDLYCYDMHWDKARKVYKYSTGVAVAIPENHVGIIAPRSSIYKRGLVLVNSIGIIDSGYRGEIMFMYGKRPDANIVKPYQHGERLGQLMVLPYPSLKVIEVNNLNNTTRGEDGFGSTGN